MAIHPTAASRLFAACVLVAALLAPAVSASNHQAEGSDGGFSADMAEARREVRADLARARAELEAGNLELGESRRLGRAARSADDAQPLPSAEITPAGDLLIDDRVVAIDASQRRELLAYREQVIDIARAGIDIGERSANAALDVVDQGLFRLMFSAMTGRLERRVDKAVRQAVEPGVLGICRRLPDLLQAQQRLGEAVPEFRPYATMEAGDLERCMDEIHREFARL